MVTNVLYAILILKKLMVPLVKIVFMSIIWLRLALLEKKYIVDPIKDMAPVCPNCHFIIHQRKPAFSIDEVRAMLNLNEI